MSELDLGKAQYIMPSTKLTVYGYIREIEKSLLITIPSGLIVLFVLFYGDQIDQWNTEFVGKYLKLKDDNLTVTNTCNIKEGNAFGTIICEKGCYKWKFKINHVDARYPAICIGIWRMQKDKTPPTDEYFTKGKEQGYAYYLKGYKTTIERGDCGDKYGIKCKNGDIIQMILDLDKLALSFKVNGVDYGVAFNNIKQAKYKAAIWLYHEHDSVTIFQGFTKN